MLLRFAILQSSSIFAKPGVVALRHTSQEFLRDSSHELFPRAWDRPVEIPQQFWVPLAVLLPPVIKSAKTTGRKIGHGVMWTHGCPAVAGPTTKKRYWGRSDRRRP